MLHRLLCFAPSVAALSSSAQQSGNCWLSLGRTLSRSDSSQSHSGSRFASELPSSTRKAVQLCRQRLAETFKRKITFKPLRSADVKAVDLRDIFTTPLLTNKPRVLQTKVSQGKSTRSDLVETSDRAKPHHFQITDVFRHGEQFLELGSCSSVLVVGPPGSGKSTCFGRMLPYRWACAEEADRKHDFLTKIELCFVLKIRTHRDVDLTKANSLSELFQLERLGLNKDEIEGVCDFLKTNDNEDSVLIIVDGLDKRRLPKDSHLRKLIERTLPMLKYRLLVSCRPCYTAQDFLGEGKFDQILHLGGFTPGDRSCFLKSYLQVRHNRGWEEVYEKHKMLLHAADEFCEVLARLPFVTTLIAEVLPELNDERTPRTRTRFFHQIIGQLVVKDLSPRDKRITGGDLDELPEKYRTALQIIGQLALNGLFCEPPQRGFTAKELWETVSFTTKEDIRSEVEGLLHALTEHFIESREVFMSKESYRFLDSSVQEFVAAYAFVRCNHQPTFSSFNTKATTDGVDRLENFWMFAAGLSRADNMARVFSTFVETHVANSSVLLKETLLIMLEDAVPDPSPNSDPIKFHSDLWERMSTFLRGHVCFTRRWAIQRRPFDCVGHALRLLPNIKHVSIYSQSDPTQDSLQVLMEGLRLHTSTLQKLELLSMNTPAHKTADGQSVADELSWLLKNCHSLCALQCHWELPLKHMVSICTQGVAQCKRLTNFGFSALWRCPDNLQLNVIIKVIQQHPALKSLTIANLNQSLPGFLTAVVANENSKLEHLTLDLANINSDALQSIAKLVSANKSLTSIALTASDHHNGAENISLEQLIQLGRTLRLHAGINRVVLHTYALCLKDDSMISLFYEMLVSRLQTITPIQYLHVTCHEHISAEGGIRLKKLVKSSQLKAISSSRQHRSQGQLVEQPGLFKDDFPAWEPKNRWTEVVWKSFSKAWQMLAVIVPVVIFLYIAYKPRETKSDLSSSSSQGKQKLNHSVPEKASKHLDTKPTHKVKHENQQIARDVKHSNAWNDNVSESGSTDFLPAVIEAACWAVCDLVLRKVISWMRAYNNSLPSQQEEELPNHQPVHVPATPIQLESSVDGECISNDIGSLFSVDRRQEVKGPDNDADSVVESFVLESEISSSFVPSPSFSEQPPSPAAAATATTSNKICTLAARQEDLLTSAAAHYFKTRQAVQTEGSERVGSSQDEFGRTGGHRLTATSCSRPAIARLPKAEESSCNDELSSEHEEPQLSPGPQSVHVKPLLLNKDDHSLLFGSEFHCDEVVHPAALLSPFLPVIQRHLEFFIHTMDWRAVLDKLIASNTFSQSSDIYQEIVKEGLSPNKRRRRLLFYALGSFKFSEFKQFWSAFEAVHGEQNKELVATLNGAMMSECNKFITKHCESLDQQKAEKVLHHLGVCIRQPSPPNTGKTSCGQMFTRWLKENSTPSAFPDLLQAMVDERRIWHPSEQVVNEQRTAVTASK